jgi:hypothetical protein
MDGQTKATGETSTSWHDRLDGSCLIGLFLVGYMLSHAVTSGNYTGSLATKAIADPELP